MIRVSAIFREGASMMREEICGKLLFKQDLENLEQGNSGDNDKDLRAMFASGYIITPDIVIAREPISDLPLDLAI
jgi:hypothetical protein